MLCNKAFLDPQKLNIIMVTMLWIRGNHRRGVNLRPRELSPNYNIPLYGTSRSNQREEANRKGRTVAIKEDVSERRVDLSLTEV